MTQTVRFVCLHPLVWIVVAASVMLTVFAVTAKRLERAEYGDAAGVALSWPHWELIAKLASLIGWPECGLVDA